MVILTGDTHGDFDRIEEFCEEYDTTTEDIMIILGDSGINYWLDERDIQLKELLVKLPITIFCIHGNHEERPEELCGYDEMKWHGGTVWVEANYPNLLFAQDGETYEFGDKQALVIGGAYSVDKYYRLANDLPWFATEQPDDRAKKTVEQRLNQLGWRVDYVFSHTVPLNYIPHHALLPTIDKSTVDRSTEKWLDGIERKLDYECWYAGHYHVTCGLGRVHILFEDYEELE